MKKVLRGIGETIILNLIVLFIFSIIQKGAYLYLNPHPIIFIGIIIVLRYGIILGISSSIISSAIYILILYFTNGELRYGIYDIFFDYKNVYISILTSSFISMYIYKFKKEIQEKDKDLEELLKEYKLIEKTTINSVDYNYQSNEAENNDVDTNLDSNLYKEEKTLAHGSVYDDLYKLESRSNEYNLGNSNLHEEDKSIGNGNVYDDLYNDDSKTNKYNLGNYDLYEEERSVGNRYVYNDIYDEDSKGNEYNFGNINLYDEKENKHINDRISSFDERVNGYNFNTQMNKEAQKDEYNYGDINSYEDGRIERDDYNYHSTDTYIDENKDYEQSYTTTNSYIEEIETQYDYNKSHIHKEESISNPMDILNMNNLKSRVDEKKRRKENYNLFVYKISNVDINTVYKIVNPMVNTDDTLAYNIKSGLFYILFGKNDSNHISSVEEGIKFIFDKKMVRV